MPDNEPMSWADIAAQIRGIGEPGQSDVQTTTRTPFRIVVATDFSQAATTLSVLKAYAAMFPADAPVELVLAVPHEPTDEDVSCAQVLLEGLDVDTAIAPVRVESFAEAAGKSAHAAVVSNGDLQVLVMELGAAFTAMHRLATVVADADLLAREPEPVDVPNAALQRRFVSFCEVTSAADPAAGVFAESL
ncbi:MAG: hypothetical protein LCH98_12775 [Actinobacteria bacterium]|nr:hypothetical protein [Actinomycetota bacterium]